MSHGATYRRRALRLFFLMFCSCALLLSMPGCSSEPSSTSTTSAKSAASKEKKETKAESTSSGPGVSSGPANQKEMAELEKLRELGYLQGTSPKTEKSGVTIHDKERAYPGLNFYMAGHEPAAYLMDMDGNVLHTWRHALLDAYPDFKITERTEHHLFWRRAFLLDNGDVLAIHEGIALLKLDKNSKLVWIYKDKAPHHDLFVDAKGRIYLLTRVRRKRTKYRRDNKIWEDQITILDKKGREIRSVSILKSLENSIYAPLLMSFERSYSGEDKIKIPKSGDLLHTNTIELVDERLARRSPVFKSGQALISILYLNLVAVLDMDAMTVPWAVTGMWKRQHEPTVLDDGNILVFDNKGNHGKSQVLEIDPVTLQVAWEYAGTEEQPFFSYNCGTSYRLPNGNTLIIESAKGRAFEVTPDKTIVWEFVNPHEAGHGSSFVASLFDMVRYGPDFSFDWLKNNPLKEASRDR